MKTACFIPIKANSERVPGKNFRLLNGKPLYQFIVEHALAAKCFDDIYIDTINLTKERYYIHGYSPLTLRSSNKYLYMDMDNSDYLTELEYQSEYYKNGLIFGKECSFQLDCSYESDDKRIYKIETNFLTLPNLTNGIEKRSV